MKANEAPEKLYLFDNPVSNEPDDRWLSKRSDEKDIEYTRTDAFIEKACKYLMDYEFNDSPTIADRRKRVEEFRNYMKGE